MGKSLSGRVDTRSVTIRRLTLDTPERALAEAERIAAADRLGKVRRLGNWEVGQVFGHLAWWIDGAFDGYPTKPPLIIRLLGPLMKKKALTGKAPQGMRLPGAPEGTYGTERLSTDEGLARLRKAFERLRAAPPARPNPVFGAMTHEQWLKLHLRHAESHLGYLVVEGDAVP